MYKIGENRNHRNSYVCEACDKIEDLSPENTICVRWDDYINHPQDACYMDICLECKDRFLNRCAVCKSDIDDILTCNFHAKSDRNDIIKMCISI